MSPSTSIHAQPLRALAWTLLLGLTTFACQGQASSRGELAMVHESAPVQAEPAAVAKLASIPAVVVSGRVLELAAGRAGFVELEPGLLGRHVPVGAPLFEIRQRDDTARVAEAEAAVRVASGEQRRAEVILAGHARDHAEMRGLAGIVAEDKIDEAREREQLAATDRLGGAARRLVSQRGLERVREELAAGRGRAPFAARVTALASDSGAWSEAGATILRLEDPTDLRLRFALEPEQARRLPLGSRLPWRQGELAQGEATVVMREPRVRAISGLVYLEATLAPGAGLVLGEVVDVDAPHAHE